MVATLGAVDHPSDDRLYDLLSDYCLNCHDDGKAKGGINLDFLAKCSQSS